MKLELSTLLWGAPLLMALGGYLLIHCIGRLGRLIVPAVRCRWADAAQPEVVALPQPGRYVINIVFPPFTVVTGTAYFSADFAISACASGNPVPYRAYGRLNLFAVRRSDMGGNASNPLGEFLCQEPGDHQVTCLNPEHIRTGFRLEVSSYVSSLLVVALILSTMFSVAMTLGGLVVTLVKLTGRL